MPETVAPADTPFTSAVGRQVLIVNPADFPVQLSALPAGTEAIGTVGVTSFPVVGTTGNAWNDVAVAAGGVSSTVNTGGLANVSVYGNVSASGTMSVNVSADGTTFYPSSNTDAISQLQIACSASKVHVEVAIERCLLITVGKRH